MGDRMLAQILCTAEWLVALGTDECFRGFTCDWHQWRWWHFRMGRVQMILVRLLKCELRMTIGACEPFLCGDVSSFIIIDLLIMWREGGLTGQRISDGLMQL